MFGRFFFVQVPFYFYLPFHLPPSAVHQNFDINVFAKVYVPTKSRVGFCIIIFIDPSPTKIVGTLPSP